LAAVERAFRCLKTVDLEIRPVHHRRAERVRAHVLLCMLAYYVETQMRACLAPILFDDHDPDGAAAERSSVVAPAQRSEAATRKSAARRTDDDLPLHSFPSLLEDLATLCLNTISLPSNPDYSFEQPTKPTPLQAKAFELLGVSPSMQPARDHPPTRFPQSDQTLAASDKLKLRARPSLTTACEGRICLRRTANPCANRESPASRHHRCKTILTIGS